MTVRGFVGVRAVLQRGDTAAPPSRLAAVDQLVATLVALWAGSFNGEGPLERFAATGMISDGTVAALQRDCLRLEQAAGLAPLDPRPGRRGVWSAQTLVCCLLAYAKERNPRGEVPGWIHLRDSAVAPHAEHLDRGRVDLADQLEDLVITTLGAASEAAAHELLTRLFKRLDGERCT